MYESPSLFIKALKLMLKAKKTLALIKREDLPNGDQRDATVN